MKTNIITSAKGEKIIVDFLTDFLGPKSEAPVYSLGFTRYLKLSRSKKKACFTNLYLQGFETIQSNQIELERRLSEMTDTEYQIFKTAK